MKKQPLFALALIPLLLACNQNPQSSSSEKQSSATTSETTSQQATSETTSQQATSESTESLSSIISTSQEASSSEQQQDSFTTKEINVYYVNETQNQKVNLRFYDSDKDIPYISIKDFYEILLKNLSTDKDRNQLKVDVKGDIYTVTAPGGVATFDKSLHMMTSDCLPFFTSTKTYETGYKALAGTDGMPWIKVEKMEPNKDPKQTVIDFASYNIHFHGDESDLYLPLPTLQDLFSDTDLLASFYNRENLYVYYAGRNEETTSFGKGIYEPCLKTDFGKDYAKFLYNEMCFDYDNLLGRPTRSSLEQYYDLSNGLNAALESRPFGKIVKNHLTDGTAKGYAIGLSLFGRLTADGGHTNVSPFMSYEYDKEKEAAIAPSWAYSLMSNVSKTVAQYTKEGYEELVNACKSYGHHGEIRLDRAKAFGLNTLNSSELRGEETYKKVGNTAFIFIDDYMGEFYNEQDWKKYYAGEGDLPWGENKGGSVLSTYKGLKKAQDDKDVKNVVTDLSSNSGGSVDEMMYVISLLTENKIGSTVMKMYDRVTDQTFDITFTVDRNLDKKFDENDKSFNLVEGKNIAVLMSQNGFSCGGISPIYLHDRGIFTMGDISGGGSCSIYYQHDGVGLKSVRSSPDAILDKNGVIIDKARATSCDHKFEIKTEEVGEHAMFDFSDFFKVDQIASVMDEHFNPGN